MSTDSQKKIIVLEGLPASGKTSIADYLCDHFAFVKVNESLGELGGANLTTDQTVIFEETVQKYALAQSSQQHTIIDRGYPSMLAWDYCAKKMNLASDLKEKRKWVRAALGQGMLFEPDLYIYLRSTPYISLQRRPREETEIDIWSGIRGMELYAEFCNDLFKKCFDIVLEVDASLSIKKISKRIAKRIGRL